MLFNWNYGFIFRIFRKASAGLKPNILEYFTFTEHLLSRALRGWGVKVLLTSFREVKILETCWRWQAIFMRNAYDRKLKFLRNIGSWTSRAVEIANVRNLSNFSLQLTSFLARTLSEIKILLRSWMFQIMTADDYWKDGAGGHLQKMHCACWMNFCRITVDSIIERTACWSKAPGRHLFCKCLFIGYYNERWRWQAVETVSINCIAFFSIPWHSRDQHWFTHDKSHKSSYRCSRLPIDRIFHWPK